MSAVLRGFAGARTPDSPWDDGTIIREELFGIERLEEHAASLAAAQRVTPRPGRRRALSVRLAENERVLLAAYRTSAKAAAEGSAITPAAEWLIDNYHLVEAQIRQIKDDLPPRYYRQLPKLVAGPFAGYPRVFGLAWACVAHSDSRFDPETLQRFVRAYQTVQPLTIGELWAVAITLRIVLVENLRRAAAQIVTSRVERAAADAVADRLLGVDGVDADPIALMRQREQGGAFSAAFVVQMIKRLRDQDPRVTPAVEWLEAHLAARGTTADEMVHEEHQQQGASNVTVRNIVTSMRLVSDVNWTEIFEAMSLVDDVLREGSDFAAMDFATRNLYRSAIEDLARGSPHTELDVAHAVVALAASGVDVAAREHDPGFHLLAAGRPAFERALGYRAPPGAWIGRGMRRLGPAGYIGVVAITTFVLLGAALWAVGARGIDGWRVAALAALGAIPVIDLAVALVNRALTRSFGATLLPGLALRDGVPPELRTMIVVPMLLTTPEAVEAQIERLEVHYLASAEGELHFALLSDWTDAASESLPEDALLLATAIAGIARLNRTHGAGTTGRRFYLFHRRRLWSPGQRRWMGWERKRGKLHELDALLRGAADTTFVNVADEASRPPPGVRYVITLDADTRLPREAARRLIGKLAHPLNRAQFDASRGRVTAGYAVLQPRVTPSLPVGREGSLFQRVYSSLGGIDPYDAAVSDVYQDLFGEGSYAGKGIYDVDAFEAALAGRVPAESMLSHDLFEGLFARAGVATDVEVVEEFPARYDVAAARDHRWTRGDWQLLPWLLGRRRGAAAVSLMGQWKMLDNLRRSLSAPAGVLALLVGWTLSPHTALIWTAFVVTTSALPPVLPVLAAVLPRRRGIVPRSHWRAFGDELGLAALQVVLTVTFLAHRAWLMSDAILRTLYRLSVSRANLLEWVTAAQAQVSARPGVAGTYRRMAGSVALAFAAACVVALRGPMVQLLAAPFILSWLAAPAVARRISVSPRVAGRLPVTPDQNRALREIARRTWRFFETFVTAEDHSLPPDNFQEDPQPVVAHRTSPTNIGLYLLSAVSARDFGWAGTLEIVGRLEATLATLADMPRHRGHFFNWYDTRDLRPLEPRYVSSVDSGNLAAHLVVVANACREWAHGERDAGAAAAGAADAIRIARRVLDALPELSRAQTLTQRQTAESLSALAAAIDDDGAPALAALLELSGTLVEDVQAFVAERDDAAHAGLQYWTEAIHRSLLDWRRETEMTEAVKPRLDALARSAHELAMAMDFGFLLDPERKLLSIGFRVGDGTLDPSCYDLLASEARLASFFAIAKNDVPTRHWFRLGREVIAVGAGAALVSWSGSMFEYLMPSLVMRAPAGSLIEHTNQLIVRRQRQYAATRDVPWGISESAYGARDLELTYQYSNFGVPGLGLKRGLGENLVIAPYATALAAMVDPQAACENFARLADLGAAGRYGFYEALDYTASRLPEGADVAFVRAFMAHHQGMSIVAIANVVFDGRMRRRFHAEPSVQATELLLQERTPRDVAVARPRAEEIKASLRSGTAGGVPEIRRLHTAHDAVPQTHLLSNGRYSIMLTSAGSGYSVWQDQAITRWRDDATRDDAGSYFYLRDVADGNVWSVGYQPCGVEPDRYEVSFSEDRAEFLRTDGDLSACLQVFVSPEDDVEVRRLSITNKGDDDRELDVTSYCELVLAAPADDRAHPAFSKLFVETEHLAKSQTLLATRRRRSPDDAAIWVAQHVVIEGDAIAEPQFETDRAKFVGRGRELDSPTAVVDGGPLSGTSGTVLDAVFAWRHRLRIPAGVTARLAFWTGIAASRAGVLDLLDRHRDANAFGRTAMLAWTQAQVQLPHFGVTAEEAGLFQRVAGHILYADGAMRPSSEAIRRGEGSRATLWAHGISGDLPIVLLRIDHLEDIAIVRQLLQAHEYWRLKGLMADLVILNERSSSYVQDLQIALETCVRTSRPHADSAAEGRRGKIFTLRTDLVSPETRGVLTAVARAVFVAERGGIADQLERRVRSAPHPKQRRARPPRPELPPRAAIPAGLRHFNGLGGFAADGREYVITLEAGQATPAPWLNVVSNPFFGFQVSAEGGGYTWSLNSRENQLTPWSNDPVVDRPGEVLYVRDEETGELFGPTPAPLRAHGGSFRVRHGQGYSRFEHTAHGIALELALYVPLDAAVKIARLTLHNVSGRRRRLGVTAYAEWVLGTSRSSTAPFIVTELDASTGALLARNPWHPEFPGRVAFADLAGRQQRWTGDRREFLGRHGRLDQPAGLALHARLSNRTGSGLDPCAALQTGFELAADERTEVVFLLGEAESVAAARLAIADCRARDLDATLRDVETYWDDVLGTISVRTPDPAMDLMLNRWLLYQTLVCRMWARSAFYQASGAYGFRDQLQDGMALATVRPAYTRAHLLRAAGRQFVEGDVQHWWLPHGGQGVRTQIADDRVWLAYAACHYLETTGDVAILDEEIPFLDGPRLRAGEHDAYFQPGLAEAGASFYEHCARGLDASLALGVHGLPLIGTGDWNDGMNRVGALGRGESVWLGWFLYATLTAFAPVAETRGETGRAGHWRHHAAQLQIALEREAWDGSWYRRGFFDDGTPLGSAASEECRIDSIAQSWAVLSGAAAPVRAKQAMAALEVGLIRRDAGLALLFAPPFDRTALDPGYIKGYPPGVRENGGQYTHAAAWSVFAFAALGQGEEAAALFALLNPISHSGSRVTMRRYKVEPYVVAADVYSAGAHVGRGGWTWYTGSAGWLYRAGIEAILGLRRRGDVLAVTPCIPRAWPGFEASYRHGATRYDIVVENPAGVHSGVAIAELDGVTLAAGAGRIPLLDDGAVHRVRLVLGGSGSAAGTVPRSD
ncbi:MAG: glycosyl transferase [Gammaproteobacteria bacterium]|nr:glycosyl transferase [Gammaproteobacteria bacterium]